MKKKIIVGNWKMNLNFDEAKILIKNILDYSSNDITSYNEIVICPPNLYLTITNELLKDSNIKFGAQNLFYEDKGAFTGEISASMLKSINCKYVILGHSERRKYFNETNEFINKKVLKATENRLNAILCVGETLQEREDIIHESVVESQLKKCLQNFNFELTNNLLIAYEPIWAIGTGKNATPQIANNMHKFIRKTLKNIFSENVAKEIPILYGGSVTPDNSKDLLMQSEIDGVLVGGASLNSDSFMRIAQITNLAQERSL